MIHVLGSINIDYGVNVEQLPAPGETVAGHGLVLSPGGKGANQALAARRAGSPVKMMGAVGSDSIADSAVSMLKADGVDLSNVSTTEGPTGCAYVFVDQESENQIVIVAGANANVTVRDARAMGIKREDVLLLQLECPVNTVVAAAEHAKSNGATVIANLAPYQSLPTETFANIDYLILSETEAQLLSNELNIPTNNVADIAEYTGCAVVKTLGSKGIEGIDTMSQSFQLPGIRVNAIDTVGAGDTFAGFLGSVIATGKSLQNACKIANVAAALACTKAGAQAAIPTMQDVIDLANQAN